LATRVHASDRCYYLGWAGSVKVVFACTSARHFDGCGCPRPQTALTGSARSRKIPAAGAWIPPRLDLWKTSVGQRIARKASLFSRQPTGVGAAVARALAGAEACAPWRRRERPGGPP
jgi:hypothetical protein